MKYLGIVLLAFAIAALAISFGRSETSDVPETPAPDTVVMLADRFHPSELSVKVGTTVSFINRDHEDDHWPASNNHPTHQDYPGFDSQRPVNPGESWSFTFQSPGSWSYHDHLYPAITGVVTVEP